MWIEYTWYYNLSSYTDGTVFDNFDDYALQANLWTNTAVATSSIKNMHYMKHTIPASNTQLLNLFCIGFYI